MPQSRVNQALMQESTKSLLFYEGRDPIPPFQKAETEEWRSTPGLIAEWIRGLFV